MNEQQSNLRNILAVADLSGARIDAILEWIDQQHEGGAQLTTGIPGCAEEAVHSWIGPRLAFWPIGIPAGRRVGLVSSRLGRDLDTKEHWFTILRAACAKLEPDDLLIAAPRTTTAHFVERCAELFDLPLLRVNVADDAQTSLDQWFREIHDYQRPSESKIRDVFLSPNLRGKSESDEGNSLRAPLRDRVVFAFSDRLIALHIRPGGQLEELVRARLDDFNWPVASVYIAVGPNLVEGRVAKNLMDRGAVGWIVFDDDRNEESSAPTVQASSQQAPIIPLPSAANWQFLTHCTRRRSGPWPEQDETEYLDDLILSRESADHSAVAALHRIIDSRRIIASSSANRGATPVVSFTSVPLIELPNLRKFRPHRGRWDFEPYGIFLRRDWLESRGTRSVRYGDDSLWQSLAPEEQPFFQVHRTTGRGDGQTIDWSVEREWRHLGDVNLNDLPSEAGVIFVPLQAEAEQLALTSPWPITVLSSPEK